MSFRPSPLAILLGIVFLDVAGMGVAIPVTPALVASFMGGDLTAAAVPLGLVGALYTGLMFLFAPLLGALSDRFGRKPVLLFALTMSALSFLGTALAPTLALLLAARALGGIGGASISVAQTTIADTTAPEARAKSFGLIGAAFGIGFIAGPALGGWLGSYGPHVPFFAAAVLTVLNLLAAAFFLPESHRAENRRAFNWAEANPLGWIVVLRRHPVVLGLAMALVWMWFGQQCYYNTWVLTNSVRFDWGPAANGASLAVVGVVSAVFMGGLTGPILKKLGERNAILLGMLMSVLVVVGYGLATQSWMMYALIVLSGPAAVAGPAIQGLVSRQVGPDQQGAVQGAMTSLNSAMGILGPLAANSLFAYTTSPQAPVQMPSSPFFLAAACLAIGTLIVGWQLNRKPEAAPEQAETAAA